MLYKMFNRKFKLIWVLINIFFSILRDTYLYIFFLFQGLFILFKIVNAVLK